MVGAGIIAILYAVVRLGQSMSVNFTPGRAPITISTDITNDPYYAARSLLRTFIALAISTVFTLVYGTTAARLRRVEKVLVPILDILRRGFSEEEARRQLKVAVAWGRYGELFDFDANTGQFRLESPHPRANG